jgi:hypothetical protein
VNNNQPSAERGQSRPGSAGEQVLSHAQAGREVVQDFVPLADSLEWELGKQYLRLRGNKAFLSDAAPVPFVVNNDGTLSRHAAEVFFASLLVAEKEGQLDGEIFVLELGIGVGLFARYFLDSTRDLCWRNKKDFYDRLCYILADNSQRMLDDVLRHGVLAEHPGRYRVRKVDALRPEEALPHEPGLRNMPRPFRATSSTSTRSRRRTKQTNWRRRRSPSIGLERRGQPHELPRRYLDHDSRRPGVDHRPMLWDARIHQALRAVRLALQPGALRVDLP